MTDKPLRPTIAYVNFDHLRFNFRHIQHRVGAGVGVMAIVKADAYGHGMLPVARACLEEGAAILGVATPDEAIELRRAFPKREIFVLGPILPDAVGAMWRSDIVCAVGSLKVAEAFSKCATRRKPARVHLKFDSGMGRFGFRWDQAAAALKKIARLPNLEIEGCFTHFAESDIPESGYTLRQLSQFHDCLDAAERAGVKPRWIHAANSGAILHFPQAFFNLVRPGIILYGCLPDLRSRRTVQIRNVMNLSTQIADVRDVPKGDSLSYGRLFRTNRASRIGILSIGYGDGVFRNLTNKAKVAVRGRLAPLVGRICMDQILVDLTDARGGRVGDRVDFFGCRRPLILTEEIAALAGTIAYEVTCHIGRRVPRVYLG